MVNCWPKYRPSSCTSKFVSNGVGPSSAIWLVVDWLLIELNWIRFAFWSEFGLIWIFHYLYIYSLDIYSWQQIFCFLHKPRYFFPVNPKQRRYQWFIFLLTLHTFTSPRFYFKFTDKDFARFTVTTFAGKCIHLVANVV